MEKLTATFLRPRCLPPAACAETLLLRGATVHTVAKGTLTPGDVLVRDGKIAAVAARIEEAADRTIDLTGLHLFPGLISAGTDLGLVEIAGVRASVDDRETGEFTPEVESWTAVNPDSELIPVARANGITHFVPVPAGQADLRHLGTAGRARLDHRGHGRPPPHRDASFLAGSLA